MHNYAHFPICLDVFDRVRTQSVHSVHSGLMWGRCHELEYLLVHEAGNCASFSPCPSYFGLKSTEARFFFLDRCCLRFGLRVEDIWSGAFSPYEDKWCKLSPSSVVSQRVHTLAADKIRLLCVGCLPFPKCCDIRHPCQRPLAPFFLSRSILDATSAIY